MFPPLQRKSLGPNHPDNQGQIQVIFGPMFSGKTTELIRRCKRYSVAKYRCVIVKYAKDTRYAADAVATHDRETLAAVPAIDLKSIRHLIMDYEVIAIDEGQFFPDTVAVSEELANNGKIVIVAALDGDFKREKFGSILDLVPFAESVVKLNAVCMKCCSDNASYTKRISNECEVEVIGGADKYIAVCRNCYHMNDEGPVENGNCKALVMMEPKVVDQQTIIVQQQIIPAQPLHERNNA